MTGTGEVNKAVLSEQLGLNSEYATAGKLAPLVQ
jgi:hypothetical protein